MEAHLISSSSDSQSSMSPIKKRIHKSPTCFFNPSTCKRQNFSIPEKILYYMAKNVTNVETYQKLVESCKYFFKINHVVVVPKIECFYVTWYACYDEENRVGFKYHQPLNFKIWATREFACFPAPASQLISSIYKNDATVVNLQSEPLKFEHFIFLAGNAEKLSMFEQIVHYKNGETVQLEDVVKNVPKLKILNYEECFDGCDVNSNTARKLFENEHFKQLSHVLLYNVSEVLDVTEMFDYIVENKQIDVDLCYREEVSDAFKDLVRKYSNLLEKENGCNSRIRFYGMDYGTVVELQAPAFEDESFDTSFVDDSNVSSDENENENEDLLFPWKNDEDEEWELPWDKE